MAPGGILYPHHVHLFDSEPCTLCAFGYLIRFGGAIVRRSFFCHVNSLSLALHLSHMHTDHLPYTRSMPFFLPQREHILSVDDITHPRPGMIGMHRITF